MSKSSLPLQGKVDFGKKRLRFCRKTEEVVLLGESAQIVVTAGGPTSSDPALRPAHLTLAGSLGPTAPLKGKAFGCASSYF